MRWIPLICISALNALPLNPILNMGEATFTESHHSLQISTSHHAMIEWESFSIQESENVHFKQPSIDSLVVNRVTGSEVSQILGRLDANGQVMLINSNGVLFGKDSQINVGALTASTVDIQGDVFSQTHEWQNDLHGKIDFLGEVIAKKIFFRAGEIEIHNDSILNASGKYQGGQIDLFANTLTVQNGAQIEANAHLLGDGGNIKLWGEKETYYYGTTSSKGGINGGKGGFVEVSGKYLDYSGMVHAPGGTLLLDPLDLTISSNANNNIIGLPNVSPVGSTSCGPSTGAATFSDLNAPALSAALDGGTNVIVSTVGSVGPCPGDIYVIAPVAWSTLPGALTLDAEGSVFIRDFVGNEAPAGASITVTANNGDVIVDAITNGTNATLSAVLSDVTVSAPNGSVRLLAGANSFQQAVIGFFTPTALITISGDIDVTAGNDIEILGGTGLEAIAYIGKLGLGPFGGGTTVTSDIRVCAGDRMNIYAGSGLRADAYIGHIAWTGTILCTGVTMTTQFEINVGHNLDMMSGATSAVSVIGIPGGFGHTGEFHINVGENLYMHNHPTNAAVGAAPLSVFIGGINTTVGCIGVSTIAQDLFLNVGEYLTLDSRNAANTGGEVFIHMGSTEVFVPVFQIIQVGGDVSLVAGANLATIDGIGGTRSINTNEMNVLGSIRCYNGQGVGDTAMVFAGAVTNFNIVGEMTIRAGGNIIQGGGFPLSTTFTSDMPIFIEADFAFNSGFLWGAPFTCPINGANIFAGTPLGAISGTTSTVTPFDAAGNGLGGFNLDTSLYNCDPILFPSSLTGGFLPIPNGTSLCPPSGPPTEHVHYFTTNDCTLLSKDRFTDGSGCDQSFGRQPNDLSFFTSPGNIRIEGFRNINFNEGSRSLVDGDITIIAQNNVTIGPNVNGMSAGFGNQALTAAGNLTIVVDNQAPVPPLIGGVWSAPGGAIFVDGAAVLESGTNGGGGFLRIYTARQALNMWGLGASLNGQLFGIDWTLGTIFVDTLQEQWCTYYPTPFNGIPFTIFYKPCLELVVQEAETIIDEFLVDLHPYNEFPGWMSRFFIEYATNLHGFKQPSEPYLIRRRHLSHINQPKSYTVYLNDDMILPKQNEE